MRPSSSSGTSSMRASVLARLSVIPSSAAGAVGNSGIFRSKRIRAGAAFSTISSSTFSAPVRSDSETSRARRPCSTRAWPRSSWVSPGLGSPLLWMRSGSVSISTGICISPASKSYCSVMSTTWPIGIPRNSTGAPLRRPATEPPKRSRYWVFST